MGSTHALGDLTLRAACDYVRAFAEVFTAPRIPFYGHLVAARAALESSVIASWLSELAIARDERVKRGLSEYLYSSTEEGWLGLSADAAERVDEWVERAASLGWEATDRHGRPWSLADSRGQPRVDGVGRPSVREGITDLLVSDEESEIGKLLWSRLSAVAHVTWFGLRWALMTEDATPKFATGLTTVPVGTNSSAVAGQALCVIKALRRAANAHFTLMGWDDDAWRMPRGRAARGRAAPRLPRRTVLTAAGGITARIPAVGARTMGKYVPACVD
jgi:hypothetical protein